MKNEFTYYHRFKTAKELDADIIEYGFRWYNWERLHTTRFMMGGVTTLAGHNNNYILYLEDNDWKF